MSKSRLSETRLARMHDTMVGYVESGHVSGVVTLISRRDEILVDAIGTKSLGGDPMQRDTIFRIASMTKPIVAVAAMTLVEECRLRLDDSVDELLPELTDMKVLRSIEGELDDTAPANRSITLRDLLTMRMGIGAILAAPDSYPIQTAMGEKEIAPGFSVPNLEPDEYMKRLGELSLVHQPGEMWMYDTASDVLGVLISRATGKSLGAFLRERIFTPLGMDDTSFTVPENKLDRLADCYHKNPETGELETFDAASDSVWSGTPVFESGAGGLVSTVDDYLSFCRMMFGEGKLGDERILSRPSVELMTTNHLTSEQRADAAPLLDGHGWGFGMSVVTDRIGLATPGTFGWDGGYTTSAHTDPEEAMISILMTQILAGNEVSGNIYKDFWTSVYQTLDD